MLQSMESTQNVGAGHRAGGDSALSGTLQDSSRATDKPKSRSIVGDCCRFNRRAMRGNYDFAAFLRFSFSHFVSTAWCSCVRIDSGSSNSSLLR